MSDRWRFVCPTCRSCSLYARQDGTYRCKQCDETFSRRFNKKHETLV